VKKALTQNQFASGGLVLMVVGGLAAWLRGVPMQMYRWIYSRLVLTVHVQSRDPAFDWLRVWILSKPESKRMRTLELSARDDDEGGGFTVSSGKHAEQRALLTPISGLYTLRFQGKLFLLEAERRQLEGVVGHYQAAGGNYERSFTLQTAFWNRSTLENLIAEAYCHTVRPQEPQLTLWRSEGVDWNLLERRPPRPLESLVYGEGVLDTVLEDARAFLADQRWYLEMGIPWRRGYLLHGPPGNGKSSLVAALAGVLELNLCPINLSGPLVDDDKLSGLMQNLPARSAVLLEDIDAVFVGRDKPEGQASKLSFNGLLNALDGVTAQEGCLVFLTTNHLERLDPALIRPGRCDLHLLINNASSGQIAGMLRRFFPEIDEALALGLAARVPVQALSMARVQEFLMRHRNDLRGALLNWSELEGMGLEELLESVA
jgi:mitochondrial chaperone BCS1